MKLPRVTFQIVIVFGVYQIRGKPLFTRQSGISFFFFRLNVTQVTKKINFYYEYSITKTKIKGSVTEASPADSGSWRLTKQESAGRFLGSIRVDQIFQLEV